MAFLTPWWLDALALVSGIGALISAIGVLIALSQLKRQKRITERLKEAVEDTLEKAKSTFNQYAVSNANRFLNEAKNHVYGEEYAQAAMRIADLADQVSQVAQVTDDLVWKNLANELREWEFTFRGINSGREQPLSSSKNLEFKWQKLVKSLHQRIDQNFGPFSGEIR